MGIDPLGLWTIKVSGYDGVGGSISFGYDQGQAFVRGGAGVGVGGGIKFYPTGSFPGTANGGERGFIGASGSVSASLGPMSAEYKGQAGDVITKDCDTGKPKLQYIEESGFQWSLRGKAGWGLSLGGGINIIDGGLAW